MTSVASGRTLMRLLLREVRDVFYAKTAEFAATFNRITTIAVRPMHCSRSTAARFILPGFA
jgi:hypothetical protein